MSLPTRRLKYEDKVTENFLEVFAVNGLMDVKIMYLITKWPYYLPLFCLSVCLILKCERVYLSLGNTVLWFENIYQT